MTLATRAMVVHDAALLIAVFYAPLLWGAFNSGGQAFVAVLIGVAALAAVIARWSQGRGPGVIPNAIHAPALAFLAVSVISAAFVSVSRHASSIEAARLGLGVVLFALVANRALLPAAPARSTAILFACSAVLVLFVRVPGESPLTFGMLANPGLLQELVRGAGGALRLLTLLGVGIVAALIAADRKKPNPVRSWVLALIVSAAFVVAFYGLREKLLTLHVLHNESWSIFSTFFNPNSLAGFLAMVLFLALGMALSAGQRWRAALWGFAAAVLLAATIPTHSKGGLLALAAGATVFAVLLARALLVEARAGRLPRAAAISLRLAIWLAPLALAVAAAAFLAVPSLRARVAAAFDPQSASNMLRLLTWEGTLRMAASHPLLGIGPGAFKYAFMNYTIAGYMEAAHQNYLQIAAEQGFIGFAAFAWMVLAVLFTARRTLVAASDIKGRVLAIAAASSITVLLVHSLLDYDWYIGAIGIVFWLTAGLIANQAHGREPEPASVPEESGRRGRRRPQRRPAEPKPVPETGVHQLWWPSPPLARGLAMAIVAGALAFSVWVPARHALADAALKLGDQASAAAFDAYHRRDREAMDAIVRETLDYYGRAVRYDPSWAAAWERYGLLLATIGRKEEGEDAVLKALPLEPTSFQPRSTLARLYYDQGRFEEAVATYREALERYPNSTRLLKKLGQSYQHLGDMESALNTYRRMVRVESSPYNRYPALGDINVDTEYAYAHYQLGRAAAKDQAAGTRPDALPVAIHEFAETLAVIAAYQERGRQMDDLFRSVGQPREDRGEELRVLEARTRWRLADAYARMGDAALAKKQREQALALWGDVEQAALIEDGGQVE